MWKMYTNAKLLNTPKVDLAFIDQCALTVEAFNAETDKCQQLRGGGCDCWESEELGGVTQTETLQLILQSYMNTVHSLPECGSERQKCLPDLHIFGVHRRTFWLSHQIKGHPSVKLAKICFCWKIASLPL